MRTIKYNKVICPICDKEITIGYILYGRLVCESCYKNDRSGFKV